MLIEIPGDIEWVVVEQAFRAAGWWTARRVQGVRWACSVEECEEQVVVLVDGVLLCAEHWLQKGPRHRAKGAEPSKGAE